MPILNRYHGCEIESSDDGKRHTLRRDAKTAGVFDTLAEAIHAARRFEDFVILARDLNSAADDRGDSDKPAPSTIDQSPIDPEIPTTD